jgi:HSP20 family protein
MATRSETTDVRQQGQQNTQRLGNARQSGEVGSETRSDRERGLQTDREGRSHTGMVRSDRPEWGLTAGAPARSPFALMRRMMDDMDRIFEDFGFGHDFGRRFGLGSGVPSLLSGGTALWPELTDGGSGLWSPAVEVFEKGDKLVVRAEIPGVSRENVNVDVTDDALTIEGERRQESEDRGEGYYRSERSYGRFFRTIPLPEGIDAEKAEAKFKDGVLEVTLPAPQRERKRGRKISIR